MQLFKIISLFVFVGLFSNAYAQQDVDFHLNAHLLPGKNILKVKRDFKDPYLWVLAQNNEVYRINSLTNGIENFTSVFGAYSGFQFIDIAGRSKDTVFVATNSSNVIAYYSTAVSVIGAANGVRGAISSIGIDYSNSYYFNGTTLVEGPLMISTDKGLCAYDFHRAIMETGTALLPSRIFEATYRSELISYLEAGDYPDVVSQYPVIAYELGRYGGYLWYGTNEYGYNINPAYYTRGIIKDNGYVTTYMNLYWGTEKGLFQNNRAYSNSSSNPKKKYLDGIKVNKITSIYGLTTFGSVQNPGLIKENLLVGTDQGLYFSNSGYWDFSAGPLNNYDFFHYESLGNKIINDICVNATSYSTPVCEDGVWIGAIDGLYLIKPDFGKYINIQNLQAVQFQSQNPATNTLELCASNSVDAVINNYVYTGNAIQWYKNGVELPLQENTTLNITQPGDYYAVLYDPCSTYHAETNHLKVSVTSTPIFTFSYPDIIENCAGTSTTLKIDADNPAYQYRWYQDGVLNGNTSATQNTTQNGIYKAEISACSGTWVATKEVQVKFINLQQPAITASKATYCIGEQGLLSTNILTSNEYTINWYRNGTIISSNTNQTTLLTDVAATYTVSINSNTVTCSKTSPGYNLMFNPIPTLMLEKYSNTAFCDGETIDLKATFNTGNITWSTGAVTPSIQVKNTGTYTATVNTVAGCTITKDITVTLFPKPKLNMPDAALCEFTNEQITLTAPTGFSSYMWNGQLGGRSYVVKSLGTVSLVVTDQNNCTASETINITSHCNAINMPNTFTPNGDGVNDTWEISGINNDLKTNVTIFNRLGTVVFTSRGYPTPWNGEYQGRKLPMGTYYYIISTGGNKQILSGSITIIN